MMLDDSAQKMQSPFAEARVLAQRALDLAQRHRVPPYPRAYEVFFTYMSGGNDALKTRVENALSESRTLSPALIDELYKEFLSSGAVNEGVTRLGDRMDTDLGEVVDLLEGGIVHGDALTHRIERADGELGRAGRDPAELRRIVGDMLRDTKTHTRAIARMGSSLEVMRKQFSAMQRELRELRQSVLIDTLTQLPNRRFFDDAIARMTAEATRANRSLGLILVDLDHFKAFNERWGRAAGDTVLEKCAGMLRSASKEGDVVCRIDGDVFAMLLPGIRPERAAELGEGIRRAISEIRLVKSTSREAMDQLSASVSVTGLQRGDAVPDFFARAIDGLMAAKSEGRDRVISG